MLYKTRGIVFKNTDYSENSVIVQVFTEKFGLQSYLINGVKKSKAKIRNNILQPLYLLEMVVYYKPAGNIQRVSDIRQVPVFLTIPYDIRKSSIVLFLNEVLHKAIRQQTSDELLFHFIFHSIELLDKLQQGITSFHLYFLLRLTKYLGFYPERSKVQSEYFDLREGIFTNAMPNHPQIIKSPETKYWLQLLESNYESLKEIKIPPLEKKLILQYILDYYQIHIEGFSNVKSHQILEEVLN